MPHPPVSAHSLRVAGPVIVVAVGLAGLAASMLLGGCLDSFVTQGGAPNAERTTAPSGTGPAPEGGGDMAERTVFDLAGPAALTGSLSVQPASSSQSLRLDELKELPITVSSQDGLAGVVTLSVEGLPAGVDATFDPPGGTLAAGGTLASTLRLHAASDAAPRSGLSFQVRASSGAIAAVAPITVDVLAELIVRIRKGVNIGTAAQPNLTAFGAQTITTTFIAPGTKVTFVNEDSIDHQIHTGGALGIAHEGSPLKANAGNTYTQTFNATGTLNFNCHIHPNMKGQIVVK